MLMITGSYKLVLKGIVLVNRQASGQIMSIFIIYYGIVENCLKMDGYFQSKYNKCSSKNKFGSE